MEGVPYWRRPSSLHMDALLALCHLVGCDIICDCYSHKPSCARVEQRAQLHAKHEYEYERKLSTRGTEYGIHKHPSTAYKSASRNSEGTKTQRDINATTARLLYVGQGGI